ncbi:hypothetical protein NDU88_005868 [Pleurodeles waltl]|uniref:Secreted protein n=1 Tax=Pleurodeles waltl TaxID=8319 RepID=A0AAV7MXZ1_PLEWA|nr:hypothetical protein NDU88_005868 [Pleurodeles waltl]
MILHWLWWICGTAVGVQSLGALAAGQDGCTDQLPQHTGESLPTMSSCAVRCATESYIRMLSSKTEMSVLFTEALTGDENNSCWLLRLRCRKGEKMIRAFVVLDVEAGAQPAHLLITAPSADLKRVWPQLGDTGLLSPGCGLRFEVTKPFKAAENAGTFCVRTLCSGRSLCQPPAKCPPFLVTIWDSTRQPGG